MLKYLLCFAFTLCAVSAAHAGAWLQPEGEGLFIAQARYYSSDSFFDANAQKQPQQRFSKYELQPYIEYGLTDWLTLGGTAFMQRVGQSGRQNIGLADPEIFARTLLWRNDSQLISLQPAVKFASKFRDEAPPRGGSSSTDVELALLYGRNLNVLSNRDYLDSRIGYRLRNNGRSPELRSDMALGVNITEDIQVTPALRSVIATAATDATFSENGDIDSTSLTAELGGMFTLDATQWLQASVSQTLYGIQSGNGYAITLGYAKRF